MSSVVFQTGWARFAMRLQMGLFGSPDLGKWAVARFLRGNARIPPEQIKRWRSRFLTRSAPTKRARLILASRIAVHMLIVERPLMILFAAVSAIFIAGVVLGSLFS